MVDFWADVDAPGKNMTFKIQKTQIHQSSTAKYEQISKLLTPSWPQGSIGVGPALSSMISGRCRLFWSPTRISRPLKHQNIAFLDHLRIFRDAAPPARPQISRFHKNFVFWDGRFYSGGNYAVPDSVQKYSQPEGVAIDRKGIMMRVPHAQTRPKCNFCTHAALTLHANITISKLQFSDFNVIWRGDYSVVAYRIEATKIMNILFNFDHFPVSLYFELQFWRICEIFVRVSECVNRIEVEKVFPPVPRCPGKGGGLGQIVIWTRSPAKYEQISKSLAPLEPRGSI